MVADDPMTGQFGVRGPDRPRETRSLAMKKAQRGDSRKAGGCGNLVTRQASGAPPWLLYPAARKNANGLPSSRGIEEDRGLEWAGCRLPADVLARCGRSKQPLASNVRRRVHFATPRQ